MNIKKIILEQIFIDNRVVGKNLNTKEYPNWVFDFRRASLSYVFLQAFTDVFFNKFKECIQRTSEGEQFSFQLCGLETASIPLLTALSYEAGKRNIKLNTFYIRKSRKKYDLCRDVEGVPNDLPVIIIDDILNSGSSINKQLEVLKREGLKVEKVFTILRFRNLEFYKFLTDQNIQIESLFELDDFTKELNVKNLENKKELQPLKFETLWARKYSNTDFRHVVHKSGLVLNEDYIYFGTDSGIFYCINKLDGEAVWTKKILFGASGKMIFSTPAIYKGYVFFGAYDGNFYCLNKLTGKQKWLYMDADWIGSSPTISFKNGYVYIGLEYGLWKKSGGVVAIDIETGKEVWKDIHPSLTHCSPFASDKNNLLFCGSNDGVLRIYKSKTGEKLKEHNVGRDIKLGFVENESGNLVAFGSFNKKIVVINTETLEIEDEFEALEAIYSNPLWVKEDLVVTALDKRIYRYDTKIKKKIWEFVTSGRVFSNPVKVGNFIYVGNNAGVLYKINYETGKQEGYIQFNERIVNEIVYDEKLDCFFVPTMANQVFCIRL